MDFLNVNLDWIIQNFRIKIKLVKIKCFNQLISFDLYKIGFEGGDEKRASSEKMGGDNKQQRREINSFSSPALFLPMTINNPQAKFSSFSQKQNILFKVFDESRKNYIMIFELYFDSKWYCLLQAKFSSFCQKQNILFKVLNESRKNIIMISWFQFNFQIRCLY